jgi:two-component system chemotaxis sensor kinase CheA
MKVVGDARREQMTNELAQDENLLREFVTESEEQLQKMEQDLLLLESNSDPDSVNRLFRAMHTIKGTSSFLGFDVVVELTHSAEDLLNTMRRQECEPNKRITDVLLQVCDQVRRMLQDISAHCDLTYDIQPLLLAIGAAKAEAAQAEAVAPKLGQILSAQPVIGSAELNRALVEAEQKGAKLGEVLVEKGLATPAQVEQALTKQGVAAAVGENTTMRVDVRKLDHLVNLVGELVLERNRLSNLSRELSMGRIGTEKLETALSLSAARLSFITEELQTASLSTRMVPIETVFRRLPRMVRDLSDMLGKKVDLEVQGQETEIDRTMVEQISDPLVHLVRNAVDHGIEASEDRVKTGKPAAGRLLIEARPEGDQILVCISDDGRGIDTARVVRKAVEKGMITAEKGRLLTQREALELIFLPGMSTAEQVSNVSGRGVGMDVVRSNLKKLNGTVVLESTPGVGTRIQLRVPLTMAILPVLMVEVADEVYALPLRSVLETVRVSVSQIHTVEGQKVLCFSDRTIPLLQLSEIFQVPCDMHEKRSQKAVIMAVGDQRIAILVDRLLGQESTVIKSMGAFLHDSPNIAGATIGGDGRVRLVLDPASLAGSNAQMEA